MPILALLAAVQAAPQAEQVKTFGNWAVACDNFRTCEATALLPEDGDGGDLVQLLVRRDAAPDAGAVIEIGGVADGVRELRVEVDGTAMPAATASAPQFALRGEAAANLLQAMLRGRKLAVRDSGSATRFGEASLAGISAALRYMDAEQRRADTVTALVAKGSKPAGAVPAAPALPRVPAQPPSGTAAKISAATLATLDNQTGCHENYPEGFERPEVETHPLGGGKTLALLPCGNGAYNFMSVAAILGGGGAAIARFDLAPGGSEDGGGPPILVNAGWDPAKGILSSYAKGRGIGDCGNSQAYVWDGAMFRLVEAHEMPDCRGSAVWLRTWVARPEPR